MNILDVLFEQKSFHRILSKIERVFKKFPRLPQPLMEFLVSILPGIFFALGVLHGVIGALVMISSVTPVITPTVYLLLVSMLAVANGLFMLLAFSEIKKRSMNGWRTLVLINTVSIVQAVLSLFFTPQAILSVLVYIFVTLYVTFEFKNYFED